VFSSVIKLTVYSAPTCELSRSGSAVSGAARCHSFSLTIDSGCKVPSSCLETSIVVLYASRNLGIWVGVFSAIVLSTTTWTSSFCASATTLFALCTYGISSTRVLSSSSASYSTMNSIQSPSVSVDCDGEYNSPSESSDVSQYGFLFRVVPWISPSPVYCKIWIEGCARLLVGASVEGPANGPPAPEYITCTSLPNISPNALCKKHVLSIESSSTMTSLPINPYCTMSRMLVVMPNATSPHLSGKFAYTILCNFLGDLSSLSIALGILSSFHTSVNANGNCSRSLRIFGATFEPAGCSITSATLPMACTVRSTCPLYLRSCVYDGTT
jgi:hypothetical protein